MSQIATSSDEPTTLIPPSFVALRRRHDPCPARTERATAGGSARGGRQSAPHGDPAPSGNPGPDPPEPPGRTTRLLGGFPGLAHLGNRQCRTAPRRPHLIAPPGTYRP